MSRAQLGAREQAFAEQLHHLIRIPVPERVKGAVVRTKHACPTRRAPKPGKAVFDEATAHEPSQHPLDHRPQRAMLPSEAGGPDSCARLGL
jgi:hypothetical protein